MPWTAGTPVAEAGKAGGKTKHQRSTCAMFCAHCVDRGAGARADTKPSALIAHVTHESEVGPQMALLLLGLKGTMGNRHNQSALMAVAVPPVRVAHGKVSYPRRATQCAGRLTAACSAELPGLPGVSSPVRRRPPRVFARPSYLPRVLPNHSDTVFSDGRSLATGSPTEHRARAAGRRTKSMARRVSRLDVIYPPLQILSYFPIKFPHK